MLVIPHSHGDQEIHGDDLPHDHDGAKEDGVGFLVVLELINKLMKQMTVVNDLSEHDNFEKHDVPFVSSLIAAN